MPEYQLFDQANPILNWSRRMSLNAPTRSLTRQTQGYLIALLGTVIWSSTAILIRYLTENYEIAPLTLAFWRDLMAFATLAAAWRVFRPEWLRVRRTDWVFMGIYGTLMAVFNGLWTVSVALNGAAVATVLAYNSSAFTAFLGWRLFGEKLGPAKLLAVSLSLLGCVLVAGAHDPAMWRGNALGVICGLGAGLCFAGYSLMGREAARRGIPSWTALTYAFGGAAVVLWVGNVLLAQSPLQVGGTFFPAMDAAGWGILFALAAGPTIGGYGFYTLSLAYLPASVANLIATLEPSLTAVQAYAFLGESFTLTQIVGSLMVIAGVVILRISEAGKGDGGS